MDLSSLTLKGKEIASGNSDLGRLGQGGGSQLDLEVFGGFGQLMEVEGNCLYR